MKWYHHLSLMKLHIISSCIITCHRCHLLIRCWSNCKHCYCNVFCSHHFHIASQQQEQDYPYDDPPEEALAGAHQGGELEVIRAQNHLLYHSVLHCNRNALVILEELFDHFLQCVVLKMLWKILESRMIFKEHFLQWIQMLTFWKILESPIQQRRSQCREGRHRWGIGACSVLLPDHMIIMMIRAFHVKHDDNMMITMMIIIMITWLWWW